MPPFPQIVLRSLPVLLSRAEFPAARWQGMDDGVTTVTGPLPTGLLTWV